LGESVYEKLATETIHNEKELEKANNGAREKSEKR